MSSKTVPEYRKILGKVEGLQRGFTSGTCALAASMGALLLLKGELSSDTNADTNEAVVEVVVGKGLKLPLPVYGLSLVDGVSRCCIIKDSGDDDDVTDGKLFCAELNWEPEGEFIIEGGPGIGRITREGLPLKPGEWAINPGPRRMIKRNLEPLLPEEAAGSELKYLSPKVRNLPGKHGIPASASKGEYQLSEPPVSSNPGSESAYKPLSLC